MTDETAKRFAHLKFGVRTDVGRKRQNNEDSHGEWPAQGVFCVADGMGGAQDGEVASRAVVESLSGIVPRWSAFDPPLSQEDRLRSLERGLDAASAWIKDYADSQGKKGCGSTFVGVAFDPSDASKACALHAGDSRVYRIRGRKIVRITRDHSVAEMTGVKDERELSPMFRSMILRAVGIKPKVETERTEFDVAEGDWILLCSDGLSRMVDDSGIARLAVAAGSPDVAVSVLVDRANELGGKDNVTVVAIRVGAFPKTLRPVHARLSPEEEASLLSGKAPGSTDSTAATGETGRSLETLSSTLETLQTPSASRAGTVRPEDEVFLPEDEDDGPDPAPGAGAGKPETPDASHAEAAAPVAPGPVPPVAPASPAPENGAASPDAAAPVPAPRHAGKKAWRAALAAAAGLCLVAAFALHAVLPEKRSNGETTQQSPPLSMGETNKLVKPPTPTTVLPTNMQPTTVKTSESDPHAEGADEVSHAETAEVAENKPHAETAEVAESEPHAETAEEVSHAETAKIAENKPPAEDKEKIASARTIADAEQALTNAVAGFGSEKEALDKRIPKASSNDLDRVETEIGRLASRWHSALAKAFAVEGVSTGTVFSARAEFHSATNQLHAAVADRRKAFAEDAERKAQEEAAKRLAEEALADAIAAAETAVSDFTNKAATYASSNALEKAEIAAKESINGFTNAALSHAKAAGRAEAEIQKQFGDMVAEIFSAAAGRREELAKAARDKAVKEAETALDEAVAKTRAEINSKLSEIAKAANTNEVESLRKEADGLIDSRKQTALKAAEKAGVAQNKQGEAEAGFEEIKTSVARRAALRVRVTRLFKYQTLSPEDKAEDVEEDVVWIHTSMDELKVKGLVVFPDPREYFFTFNGLEDAAKTGNTREYNQKMKKSLIKNISTIKLKNLDEFFDKNGLSEYFDVVLSSFTDRAEEDTELSVIAEKAQVAFEVRNASQIGSIERGNALFHALMAFFELGNKVKHEFNPLSEIYGQPSFAEWLEEASKKARKNKVEPGVEESNAGNEADSP